MLADLEIPRLSNDMKIPVQKNRWGQILYRSLVHSKKRRQRVNAKKKGGKMVKRFLQFTRRHTHQLINKKQICLHNWSQKHGRIRNCVYQTEFTQNLGIGQNKYN